MHDTVAPEASHRFNVKKVINRVRKGTDFDTAASAIDWVLRVRTWSKIIDLVDDESPEDNRRPRRKVTENTFVVKPSKLLTPPDCVVQQRGDDSFSPLSRARHFSLLCNDVRLSYQELATLVSSFTSWDINHVKDNVNVRLFCSARVHHPGGETRNYWATESRYMYNKGVRRDHVAVDLGQGKIGAAEIVTFISIDGAWGTSEGVVVRWMDKSTLSTECDQNDRPMCTYPLSSNHRLWQWATIRRDRACLKVRGFMNKVREEQLWSHIEPQQQRVAIESELKAYYDIIKYSNIIGHINVHVDPSTGHMLQTLQIV